MKFKFDHDLHIHSFLSGCSKDPEQTPERMIRYAKENNLHTICVTDHYWDSAVEGVHPWYAKANFDRISQSKPLPQADGIRFLFGCETEMRKDMTIGVPPERYDDFDFIIIPTTHWHILGYTIDESDHASIDIKARLWIEKLDALLSMDLPFHKVGFAHLLCQAISKTGREEYLALINAINGDEMARVFTKAAKLGVGIELNKHDMSFSDEETDIVLRPFRIAKACGCKFYLGSDAHKVKELESVPKRFERIVELLDLQEEEKFMI